MAGYQHAHSSPLSIRSNFILNSSMFYSLGASRIFFCRPAAGPETTCSMHGVLINVMQSFLGCGTVCRRWI